jgi:tetratricopeptide (TPR) repeat protein
MSFCSILQDKIKSSQNEIEVLLKNGKAELCLMKISRALVLDPHNVTFHYLRGEAFLLLGEHMLAIKSITKALRLEPSDSLQEKLAFAYCYFGDFLYGKEQYQEALINYKLANGLLPKFFSQCISCHIHLREYQNAMSVIEYALSLGITTELLVARAKLFLLFGNTARCYEDVHHSLELEPTCEEGLQLMDKLEKLTSTAQRKALDYCLIKSRKEALRQMNLAIDSHPHDANHYILRGEIHRESNLFSEAIDDFLLAMDKCGHSYDNPLYIEASYELVLTFNSFAVECFKYSSLYIFAYI